MIQDSIVLTYGTIEVDIERCLEQFDVYVKPQTLDIDVVSRQL